MSASSLPTAGLRVRPVDGWCPMGCGETLYLLAGGVIQCARGDCPRPTAVAELIADRETEHLVDIFVGSFAIQHPLRERLDGALRDCRLGNHIVAVPPKPGSYRVRVRPGEVAGRTNIDWELLASPAAPPADQPLFPAPAR